MDSKHVESKNATTAKNGFQAEREMCVDPDVKQALELYFGKTILSITKVERKKYDLVVRFEHGSVTLQNKDGGSGRGWSVDRRPIDAFQHPLLSRLFRHMCLTSPKNRDPFAEEVPREELSQALMKQCLLGEDPPTYFTHTVSNKTTKKILSIGICRTEDFMDCMYRKRYPLMVLKRSCIHLSPNCYLQRKGGGKTDSRPDDVQMKFRWMDEVDLFTPIFTRTTLL